MENQMEKRSILEMSRGAILERADYEMSKIVDNILDINTKAAAKRKLTLVLEMVPSADRSTITVQTTAKTALVPTEPVTTSLFIANEPNTGEMVVAEMMPQVPGQFSLTEPEAEQPKVLKLRQA